MLQQAGASYMMTFRFCLTSQREDEGHLIVNYFQPTERDIYSDFVSLLLKVLAVVDGVCLHGHSAHLLHLKMKMASVGKCENYYHLMIHLNLETRHELAKLFSTA